MGLLKAGDVCKSLNSSEGPIATTQCQGPAVQSLRAHEMGVHMYLTRLEVETSSSVLEMAGSRLREPDLVDAAISADGVAGQRQFGCC